VEYYWKSIMVGYFKTHNIKMGRESVLFDKDVPIYDVRSIQDDSDPIMAVGMVLADISNGDRVGLTSQMGLVQSKYMKHRVRVMMDDMGLKKRPLSIFLTTRLG
jgi:hypothetical protein